MKLQHKDKERYRASKVTTHYDNHLIDLEVQKNGVVEVENQRQAEALQEDHGQFEVIQGDKEDLSSYVLEGKTVDEVEQYIKEINDVDRLKELRKKEDRKTAVEHIDSRISKVKENQPIDADYEEVEQEEEGENENGNQSEDAEDGEEDGEETENE